MHEKLLTVQSELLEFKGKDCQHCLCDAAELMAIPSCARLSAFYTYNSQNRNHNCRSFLHGTATSVFLIHAYHLHQLTFMGSRSRRPIIHWQ